MPWRASAVTWTGAAIDEASRCALAIRGVGGKTGIHTTIKRRTKERSFISFTSRGALYDGLKYRESFSGRGHSTMLGRTTGAAHQVCPDFNRLRRLTCRGDFMEKQT